MLDAAEISRYQRHLQLSEIGMEGQEKIKTSSVLVIGAGGLGCPVLQYLTALGVGTIGIVDHDIISESNLQRQVLYYQTDINKSKVDTAVERLGKQNPNVKFIKFIDQLTNKNALDILKDYDIVVDGTDNFATRYLINDACAILKKPLVFGAIHKFEGQVSVFNYKDESTNNGVNYRDLFPVPPSPEQAPNCSEVGVIGVLPGIIGTLQATEVLKIITGIGKVLSGELLFLNALEMQFYKVQITSSNQTKVFSIDEYKNFDYGQFCILNEEKPVSEISVSDLKYMLESDRFNLQLIDVREINELPVVEELIEINIPFALINEAVIKIDKNKKVILICKSGVRSKMAIQKLQRDFGIKNLHSLRGGVTEWLNCKNV
ncbi:MAG: molybdopterin-synthase adenylyltransferase MoeB [Bacteroidetes bacterium]|nr:molybdopterin-synthase adenylyltransferase MoeB [Bacteroidota bacterium]